MTDMLGNLIKLIVTVPAEMLGTLADLVWKLTSDKGPEWFEELKKFLRKEKTWAFKAFESKGIVPVSLTEVISDGLSGPEGIEDLKKSGYRLGNYAKDVMRKPEYLAIKGKKYKPVVLKGEDFEYNDCTASNIRKIAKKMKFMTPPVELVRLLRKSVSDEEIQSLRLSGLIVMHKPIADYDGNPSLLGVLCHNGGQGVCAFDGKPDHKRSREFGFVFLLPAQTDTPQEQVQR